MQKSLLGLVFALMAMPAWAADPPPGPATAAPAGATEAQQLAAACAKVTCRKAVRQIALRMLDGSTFQISTKPLPYIDGNGNLILFPGESVTLSYADDDTALNHPVLSMVTDPLGPVALPPPPGKAALTFTLQQLDGKPDMMLTAANATRVTVKYDTVMFVPDPASGGVKGTRTSTCPLLSLQGSAPNFSGFESWAQPIALLLINNIRALPEGAPQTCN